MSVPSNYKFAKTDEWVKVEGNIATIGISDYAQEQLSDIVYLEIEVAVDDNVEKEIQFATVESVKAAGDINSPVSGKVVEVNESLSDNPELLNSDPFNKAWLIKVELSNPSDLDSLFDASAYEKYCEERS
ncbi:MAG: glycine cleavage system protein GcvH [Anaerolineaceae bacterium]|nr:glycine cleavage system protein GcvH [Anaerolineaceae bacterium]